MAKTYGSNDGAMWLPIKPPKGKVKKQAPKTNKGKKKS